MQPATKLPPALHLGPIRLDAPTALAPMAALTDTVFRRMIKRQGGCGFVVTEMASAEALIHNDRRALGLLRYAEEERPIGGQIAGARLDSMVEAARIVERLGFDFIDINMGCPARKVVSGGGGSAMMRDLANTARILSAIRKAITIPLTIKLRAGWNDDCLNAPEVAKIGEDCGAALVSVHARTRVDQYRPTVRDEILIQTREAVKVPVFANGDIRSRERALELMRTTGCDGVMSGRGAVANPWLLRDIATGDQTTPTAERARHWILDHYAILQQECAPRELMSKLKTFAGWYTRGLMGGGSLRQRINELASPEQFRDEVEEFFANYAATAASMPPAGLTAPHQESRP